MVYLSEILELFSDQKMIINLVLPHLDQVMDMISKNILRPLSVLKINDDPSEPGDDDDDVDDSNPSWPHLLVYFLIIKDLIIFIACLSDFLEGS